MKDKKWEKMYSDVVAEGKTIKRKRTLIKSFGATAFVVMLALTFVFSGESKVESVSPDLTAEVETIDEIEVAMVVSDAFFDNDLGVIY